MFEFMVYCTIMHECNYVWTVRVMVKEALGKLKVRMREEQHRDRVHWWHAKKRKKKTKVSDYTCIQYTTYNRKAQKSGRRKKGSCSRDTDNEVVHWGGSLRHEDRAAYQVATSQLHAAYAALTPGVPRHWSCISKTIPIISLQKVILPILISAFTGYAVSSELEGELLKITRVA